MHSSFPSFRTLRVLFVLWLAMLAAARVDAQSVTGSIYGTVTDSSDASVPNATITILNVNTNVKSVTTSSGSGAYVFPVVSPGTYRVTATVSGFKTMSQSNLVVAANQNVNASFALTPGEVASEITVEATAALIDTRESQIGTTIQQKVIQDLPLLTRSPYDLVQLVPGITGYSAGTVTGDNTGTMFSSNGLRPNMNSFYLDGAYDTSFFRGGGNVIPNPDALSQFRILTSNFDAEFGRYPGAVINVITRSGSNAFHGTAYDFLRNNIFNAKNYFESKGVTHYVYNTFGAGVGGPIVRDRLFFYVSYQGLRFSQPLIVTAGTFNVPTPAERAGDFSASTTKPTASLLPAGANCGTATAVVLCPSAISPIAAKILPYIPASDPASPTKNAEFSIANPQISDQGTGRIDYRLAASHQLAFTYFNSQGNSYDYGSTSSGAANRLFSYAGNHQIAGQTNYILADTWTVSPKMVSTSTIFYTNNKVVRGNVYGNNFLSDLGFNIPNGQAPGAYTQPYLAITGYFNAGAGPLNSTQLTAGIGDTVNWVNGAHSVKFGGSFNFNKYHETAAANGSSLTTFGSGANSRTKNPITDFLLGLPYTFVQNNGATHRLHQLDPSLFVQDNWRISRRLTLNLGTRWEVFYPFSGQNTFGTFDTSRHSTRFPGAPNGLLLAGDPGVPDGVLHASYLKFAPRVGFALDVFGDGRTSLRGGYGLFFATSQETFFGNLKQQPYQLSVSITNPTSWANPYAGSSSFTSSPFPYVVSDNPTFYGGTSVTFAGMKPNSSTIPYVHNYNLTAEQQWGSSWSTRISYVGLAGRHFYFLRDQNAPVFVPGAATTDQGKLIRRPLYLANYYWMDGATRRDYGSVVLLDPSNNSSYNSLQVSINHPLKNRFAFGAFYVWSKNIDLVSADPGGTGAGALTLVDQFNPAADRGLSSIHVPHRFVANFVYQLPTVKRFGIIGKEILSGWQLNGITTLSSGTPFNITANNDSNLDGINNDRPNLVGNPFLAPGRPKLDRIQHFFNNYGGSNTLYTTGTAAFARPAANVPAGTLPRNFLVGPGYVNQDISAFKRFALFKEADLMYRVEAFNAFNNTNLNNPAGTFGSTTFGTISTAKAPRILQMAIKLEF